MAFYDIFETLKRELERIRRRIEEELERAMFTSERLGWSPEGFLEPLYQLYEYPDRYVILVDLAGADTATLDVKVVGDKLVLESRLSREVRYSDIYGTVAGRDVRFHAYRHILPLPPDAEPRNMRVKVHRNKVVEIVIPKKHVVEEK